MKKICRDNMPVIQRGTGRVGRSRIGKGGKESDIERDVERSLYSIAIADRWMDGCVTTSPSSNGHIEVATTDRDLLRISRKEGKGLEGRGGRKQGMEGEQE